MLLAGTLITAATTFTCKSPESPFANLPIAGFNLTVYTAEGDTTRHLLTVGDSGQALVEAWGRRDGCYTDSLGITRSCGGPLPAEFTSSNGNIVSPARQSVMGFADVLLRGRAVGSVLVSATLRDTTLSRRMDVVVAPLPVDSVRVQLVPFQGDSILAGVTDAVGNLRSMTLPAGASYYTLINIFRGHDSAVYLLLTFESSDSSIASWGAVCTSACVLRREAWVQGNARGTAQLTVTARNQRYSFLVTVR